MIKISVLRPEDIDIQKIEEFTKGHWGKHIDTPEDLRLNFFAPHDYYVLSYSGSTLIGLIALQIRKNIMIGDTPATCGTIGGVVVHRDYRMQGIAQSMLKEAMAKFAKEKVDIAILCTEISKLGKMYGRVGFVPLNKPYFFYNLDGVLMSDNDGMIASVTNKKLFDLAMQPNTKINIGESDA